ncbi:hypothetical protein NDU88_000801 [Pleurodeles waltl]|uniref:Uncharacterized protein n=1 Tax=Pleurodeles waltl TaxID=8319 RepID=A0AAV7UQZ4_PLEWA|nr:hypothetical protein NDU88_000801 [Pleurodeles waltl]
MTESSTFGEEDAGPEALKSGTRGKEDGEPKTAVSEMSSEEAGPETALRAEGGGVRTSRPCHVPGGEWLDKVWSFW